MSTPVNVVADTAVPICGGTATGRFIDPSGTITADSAQLITQPLAGPGQTGHARAPQHLCEMTISAPLGSSLVVQLSFSTFHLSLDTVSELTSSRPLHSFKRNISLST